MLRDIGKKLNNSTGKNIIIQSQCNPKLQSDIRPVPHLYWKKIAKSYMLIKTHSTTAKKYCIEINVQLRTPLKHCNNKGTIKTNTNA